MKGTASTRTVRIDSLKPDPSNLRTHGDRSIDAIAASLARFGQQRPILVDEAGVVIAGNGTLEAARRLGWKTIAVVRSRLAGADRGAKGKTWAQTAKARGVALDRPEPRAAKTPARKTARGAKA